MSDLVAFLRARLDEEEESLDAIFHWEAPAGHMLRERRELEAKRETIRLYEEACEFIEMMKSSGQDAPAHEGAAEAYLNVIRNEAAVYAGHPDYRGEWRPR